MLAIPAYTCDPPYTSKVVFDVADAYPCGAWLFLLYFPV